MFQQDGYTELFVARLFDFFHRRSPWQRRLWRLGLLLELREVIEYSRVVAEQGTSDEGLRFVCESVQAEIDQDVGIGPEVTILISDQLAVNKIKGPEGRTRLGVLGDRVESEYLDRWKNAVAADEADRPRVELAARKLAAHMLDAGFSSDHLHRWLRAMETGRETVRLPDLYEAATSMVGSPEATYMVLVPFEQIPEQELPEQSQFERLDDVATAEWLTGFDTSNVRYTASLVFEVSGRDPWAAIDRAGELITRLRARAAVGHPGQSGVSPASVAYIAGKQRRYDLRQPRRQVEVLAISRQSALFDVAAYGTSSTLDDALELAATMEEGAPGAAVAGGWAAVEGLLSFPGRGEAPRAADRLAALVACSYPRAELTTLSYRHGGDDQLAADLQSRTTNRERCARVEVHLRSGGRLVLESSSDRAAEARMIELVNAPETVLRRVHGYVRQTFRRLYQQRNLVMHSGSLRSVALDATLRTAPALVGAGLDRIVHAALETRGEVPPLGLAARAESELELLGTAASRPLSDLLEVSIR